ncbi:MAG: ABC transporter permease [Alphaproteobacteria bacterium]|jgi:peptide/nickel transport system permease protein|nr:ABC transporter permease [Alphaproteobacteria bacterium]
MPTLPLSYWSALVVAGALTLYFGGRQIGGARSIERLRDITPTGAFGYSLLLVTLYQGIALYFGPGMNPGATFFRWAVHGVVGFGIVGFLFQQLGRHVGTRASKKLFRSMPVTAALGILLILIYAIVAIFADFIAPYGQAEIFKDANVLPGGNPEMGGNPAHFLGTDQIGRDILSRLIYGAQNTVGIAFVTTLLAFFIGISLGFLAATIGGVLDQVLSRIVDMLMSIPQLIFALLLMTIATAWFGSQKSMVTLFMIVIIAVLDSTRVFRLARAVGMNIVVMDFFEAAKLRGEKLSYLIFSEITPNAFAPLLAEFGLRFCFVFLTIASLSFLGIGIQPPLADWGTMVRDLSQFINFAVISPLTASLPLMAAGAIALLTVAVNFVVDWMLHRASGLKE